MPKIRLKIYLIIKNHNKLRLVSFSSSNFKNKFVNKIAIVSYHELCSPAFEVNKRKDATVILLKLNKYNKLQK